MTVPRGHRPPKFTPALVDTVLKALRVGNTRRTASGLVGVNEATFQEWMWGDRSKHRAPKPGFAQAVEQAEQEATAWYLSRVRISAQTDARHAQWWLERKGGFIKTETVVHEGNAAAPIRVESKVTVDGPSDSAERLDSLAKTLDLLAGVGLLTDHGAAARRPAEARTAHPAEVD